MSVSPSSTIGSSSAGSADKARFSSGRFRNEIAVVLGICFFELFTSGAFLGIPVRLTFTEDLLVPRWVVGAFVVVMAGLLLLRKRRPMTVLMAELALSTFLMAFVEGAQPIFCVLLALYTAGARGSRGQVRLALVLALSYVLLLAWSILRFFGDEVQLVDWIFPTMAYTFLIVTLWSLGAHDRAHRLSMDDELQRRVEQSAVAERQRIARELHDIVAHSVSAMMMQAAGARAMSHSLALDLPDEPRIKAVEGALTTIENTGSQSMRELHRLLGILRDNPLVDAVGAEDRGLGPSAQPGLADLERLIQVPRQSGLIVDLQHSGPRHDVDPSVGVTVYRVVQESLTNALKHAGRGARVDICLAWAQQNLKVQVRSRGVQDAQRPATPHSGAGLRGLRERVGLVGGTFEAGTRGEEFVTIASLPVRPPVASRDGPIRDAGDGIVK